MINQQQIVAAIRTILPLIFAVLTSIGISIDVNFWTEIILLIVTLALIVYGCYKNNNFTEAAQQAQLLLDELKAIQKKEKENA